MTPHHQRIPSPGNALSGNAVPTMYMPHLEFVYRIVADMDKEGVSEIPNVDSTKVTRIVLPIRSGTVDGPDIKGVIVERSGADWAEIIDPDKVQVKLLACHVSLSKLSSRHFTDSTLCTLYAQMITSTSWSKQRGSIELVQGSLRR